MNGNPGRFEWLKNVVVDAVRDDEMIYTIQARRSARHSHMHTGRLLRHEAYARVLALSRNCVTEMVGVKADRRLPHILRR